jgi:uncharacterized protein YodC (DUF2158 family)
MTENRKFKVGDVVMLAGNLQTRMTVTDLFPENKVKCLWIMESGQITGMSIPEDALVSVEKIEKEKELLEERSKMIAENRGLKRIVEGYKELKADLEKQIGEYRKEYEYCAKKKEEAYEGWRAESILRCEYEDRLVELGEMNPSEFRINKTREEWEKIKKAERIRMNYKDVSNEPNLPEEIK